MQIVVKHILELGCAWFIHNASNGHEYKFYVGEGNVSLQSSSPGGASHDGAIAITMLNSLTNAFASTMADLGNISMLNDAMMKAEKELEENK